MILLSGQNYAAGIFHKEDSYYEVVFLETPFPLSDRNGEFVTTFTISHRKLISLSVEDLQREGGELYGLVRRRAFGETVVKRDAFEGSVEEKDFVQLGCEVGQMVYEKNEAYGGSVGKMGKVLRQLYPEGISPSQYEDLQLVVRILDKVFRVASDKDAFDENPYLDISGYGILGAGL